MIDFIKLDVKSEVDIFLKNPLLNFSEEMNTSTGEIIPYYENGNTRKYKQKAYFKNLKFEIYSTGKIFISGSLHKYFNDGKHNYNDFNQNDTRAVLRELIQLFNIVPSNCKINALEIGLNIKLVKDVDGIINNCLLHKKTKFEHKHNSNDGNYKQFEHFEYFVKIYNKGRQFKLDDQLMRFEIKYRRMRSLQKYGISNLQDLYNIDLNVFKTDLIEEWNNVLFYDSTLQIHTLKDKIKLNISNYSNPNFWSTLIDNKEVYKYKYHFNELKKYTEKYSKNIQKSISDQLAIKIDQLTKTLHIHT